MALPQEKPIRIREAARLMRVGHCSTILRWITKGVWCNGVRIKLEGERVGRIWRTTAAALARFQERLTPADVVPLGQTVRGPGARERACRRATEELQERGW